MAQVEKLVTEAWQATDPDPIVLARGDAVVVGGRDEEWPGFVWCEAPTGRSGWVPAAFLDTPEGRTARATRASSARELTLAAGERVEILESIAGWSWSRTSGGATGWLPDRILGAI